MALDAVVPAVAAALGASVGLWWIRRRGRRLRSGVQAWLNGGMDGGVAAVRTVLDAAVPPVAELRYRGIMAQRERLAALSLVGDGPTLGAELRGHRGALLLRARVDAVGWLGLALLGDPTAATAAAVLADTSDAELGMVAAYVKRTTRALCALTAAVAGSGRLGAATLRTLDGMVAEGPMVGALLWRARLAVAERLDDAASAQVMRTRLGAWVELPPALAGRGSAPPAKAATVSDRSR